MTEIGLVALAWTLNVDVVRLAGSIMPKSLVSSVSDVTCSPPSSTVALSVKWTVRVVVGVVAWAISG